MDQSTVEQQADSGDLTQNTNNTSVTQNSSGPGENEGEKEVGGVCALSENIPDATTDSVACSNQENSKISGDNDLNTPNNECSPNDLKTVNNDKTEELQPDHAESINEEKGEDISKLIMEIDEVTDTCSHTTVEKKSNQPYDNSCDLFADSAFQSNTVDGDGLKGGNEPEKYEKENDCSNEQEGKERIQNEKQSESLASCDKDKTDSENTQETSQDFVLKCSGTSIETVSSDASAVTEIKPSDRTEDNLESIVIIDSDSNESAGLKGSVTSEEDSQTVEETVEATDKEPTLECTKISGDNFSDSKHNEAADNTRESSTTENGVGQIDEVDGKDSNFDSGEPKKTSDCVQKVDLSDKTHEDQEKSPDEELEKSDEDVAEVVDLTGEDVGMDKQETPVATGKNTIRLYLGKSNDQIMKEKMVKQEKKYIIKDDESGSSDSEDEWLSCTKGNKSQTKSKNKKGEKNKSRKSKQISSKSNNDEQNMTEEQKQKLKELEEQKELKRQAAGFICETDSDSDTDSSDAENEPVVLYDEFVELSSGDDSDREGGPGSSRTTRSGTQGQARVRGQDSSGRSDSSTGWLNTGRSGNQHRDQGEGVMDPGTDSGAVEASGGETIPGVELATVSAGSDGIQGDDKLPGDEGDVPGENKDNCQNNGDNLLKDVNIAENKETQKENVSDAVAEDPINKMVKESNDNVKEDFKEISQSVTKTESIQNDSPGMEMTSSIDMILCEKSVFDPSQPLPPGLEILPPLITEKNKHTFEIEQFKSSFFNFDKIKTEPQTAQFKPVDKDEDVMILDSFMDRSWKRKRNNSWRSHDKRRRSRSGSGSRGHGRSKSRSRSKDRSRSPLPSRRSRSGSRKRRLPHSPRRYQRSRSRSQERFRRSRSGSRDDSFFSRKGRYASMSPKPELSKEGSRSRSRERLRSRSPVEYRFHKSKSKRIPSPVTSKNMSRSPDRDRSRSPKSASSKSRSSSPKSPGGHKSRSLERRRGRAKSPCKTNRLIRIVSRSKERALKQVEKFKSRRRDNSNDSRPRWATRRYRISRFDEAPVGTGPQIGHQMPVAPGFQPFNSHPVRPMSQQFNSYYRGVPPPTVPPYQRGPPPNMPYRFGPPSSTLPYQSVPPPTLPYQSVPPPTLPYQSVPPPTSLPYQSVPPPTTLPNLVVIPATTLPYQGVPPPTTVPSKNIPPATTSLLSYFMGTGTSTPAQSQPVDIDKIKANILSVTGLACSTEASSQPSSTSSVSKKKVAPSAITTIFSKFKSTFKPEDKKKAESVDEEPALGSSNITRTATLFSGPLVSPVELQAQTLINKVNDTMDLETLPKLLDQLKAVQTLLETTQKTQKEEVSQRAPELYEPHCPTDSREPFRAEKEPYTRDRPYYPEPHPVRPDPYGSRESAHRAPGFDPRDSRPYDDPRDAGPYADPRDARPYADPRDLRPYDDPRELRPYPEPRDPYPDPRDDPRDPYTDPRDPYPHPRDSYPHPRDSHPHPRDQNPDPRDPYYHPRDPYSDPRDPFPDPWDPYPDRAPRPRPPPPGHYAPPRGPVPGPRFPGAPRPPHPMSRFPGPGPGRGRMY